MAEVAAAGVVAAETGAAAAAGAASARARGSGGAGISAVAAAGEDGGRTAAAACRAAGGAAAAAGMDAAAAGMEAARKEMEAAAKGASGDSRAGDSAAAHGRLVCCGGVDTCRAGSSAVGAGDWAADRAAVGAAGVAAAAVAAGTSGVLSCSRAGRLPAASFARRTVRSCSPSKTLVGWPQEVRSSGCKRNNSECGDCLDRTDHRPVRCQGRIRSVTSQLGVMCFTALVVSPAAGAVGHVCHCQGMQTACKALIVCLLDLLISGLAVKPESARTRYHSSLKVKW